MTKPNQVRTDGDLLAEFVVSGSQTAFAEIVQRHASMVHGVCWRVLSDPHEAQDVAQAAFVALARKAASLRRAPSIGGWLHRVAWCIAQNTRIA